MSNGIFKFVQINMKHLLYTCLQALNINEREVIASLIACSKDEGTCCDHK